jgi:hypothetical protein
MRDIRADDLRITNNIIEIDIRSCFSSSSIVCQKSERIRVDGKSGVSCIVQLLFQYYQYSQMPWGMEPKLGSRLAQYVMVNT